MANLKAQEVMPDGSAASTTKDGNQIVSSDPTARPEATLCIACQRAREAGA